MEFLWSKLKKCIYLPWTVWLPLPPPKKKKMQHVAWPYSVNWCSIGLGQKCIPMELATIKLFKIATRIPFVALKHWFGNRICRGKSEPRQSQLHLAAGNSTIWHLKMCCDTWEYAVKSLWITTGPVHT